MQDYTRHFKTTYEVFTSHIGGRTEFTKSMKGMRGYIASDLKSVEKCQNRHTNNYWHFLILTMLTGHSTVHQSQVYRHSKFLERTKYPLTIAEANNVLSEQKFDNKNA